jgi:hypothetical protein
MGWRRMLKSRGSCVKASPGKKFYKDPHSTDKKLGIVIPAMMGSTK